MVIARFLSTGLFVEVLIVSGAGIVTGIGPIDSLKNSINEIIFRFFETWPNTKASLLARDVPKNHLIKRDGLPGAITTRFAVNKHGPWC